jgi:predicted AAA+ superfamily ATPase
VEQLLQRILLENQELISNKKLISRHFHIPQTENITVLTGIRRCGKTHMLYEIAQSFQPEEILFLDFEDERLISLNSYESYDIIVDSYKTLFPQNKPIIFFDEIQNLKNWHYYLKRLQVSGFKIYVTGSNAKLLSSEIATILKGKSLETTIYPFSFAEFLELKKIEFKPKDFLINQAKIQNLFDDYLCFGGFPEVIKAEVNDKRAVAKNIYSLLFYKDLVSKYEKNEYLLKLIMSKITENITKEFSITSLAKKIIPLYKASVPTVTDYFNILPEPYLTTNIYQYRTSFVHRESKRKTYLADNSFIMLNRITTDKSRLFESLVFNYLQRKYELVHYYKTHNNREVDFLVSDEGKKILIQASVSIEDSDTLERKIAGLRKAMDEQKLNVGYIYTLSHTEEMTFGAQEIKIVPFWKVALKT